MTELLHLPSEMADAELRSALREWSRMARQGVLSADAIAADIKAELRARERGEVTFPRPMKVQSPAVPAEFEVPAPAGPRPWWRTW